MLSAHNEIQWCLNRVGAVNRIAESWCMNVKYARWPVPDGSRLLPVQHGYLFNPRMLSNGLRSSWMDQSGKGFLDSDLALSDS